MSFGEVSVSHLDGVGDTRVALRDSEEGRGKNPTPLAELSTTALRYPAVVP